MIEYIAFVALIILYTYLLKRKFNMKLLEAWHGDKLGSEVLVYVMIILPVFFAWLTTVVFDCLFMQS